MKRAFILLTAAALTGACSDRTATGPASGVAAVEDGGLALSFGAIGSNGTAASNVRVASVNMYFGAPVDPILNAPEDANEDLLQEVRKQVITTPFRPAIRDGKAVTTRDFIWQYSIPSPEVAL